MEGHGDGGTLGHRDRRTEGRWGTGTWGQGHGDRGTEGQRDTWGGNTGFWDIGTEGQKDTEIEGHRDTGT